ncbi:MAG TPA: hypothetical protein VGS61_03175, partial [Acidimicrobiales bacterium]|nr:hypothetical protein [Acidimicrobiales bacterium]
MTTDAEREGARVRVWTVDLDAAPDVVARAADVLDEGELARAGRLRDAWARRRWTVAHGALREILSACVGVDAGDLEFETGSSGKPALRAPSAERVRFNLAHSGAVALVAVCADYDVGV